MSERFPCAQMGHPAAKTSHQRFRNRYLISCLPSRADKPLRLPKRQEMGRKERLLATCPLRDSAPTSAGRRGTGASPDPPLQLRMPVASPVQQSRGLTATSSAIREETG